MRAYQVRGHHIAKLDPLGINDVDLADHHPAELELNYYGWTEKDLDKEFTLGPGILPRYAETGKDKMTLREIIGELKKMYCKSKRRTSMGKLLIRMITSRHFHRYSVCSYPGPRPVQLAP